MFGAPSARKAPHSHALQSAVVVRGLIAAEIFLYWIWINWTLEVWRYAIAERIEMDV